MGVLFTGNYIHLVRPSSALKGGEKESRRGPLWKELPREVTIDRITSREEVVLINRVLLYSFRFPKLRMIPASLSMLWLNLEMFPYEETEQV